MLTEETAGFYNTIDFNGEMRAFVSVMPLRDMERHVDGGLLAGIVTEEGSSTGNKCHDCMNW